MTYYGYSFIRESDLAHHGIKGQKWGERRFQNEDGTWTEAGKARYGDDNGGGSARSFRGNVNRALAKVYGANEKYYSKHGNKTMASMNKSAKEQQLKKAEELDKAKQEKKEAAANARIAKKATALAKVYEINEKTYTKLGNKTLASMNKAAKEQQLKIAASAKQASSGKSAVDSMFGGPSLNNSLAGGPAAIKRRGK